MSISVNVIVGDMSVNTLEDDNDDDDYDNNDDYNCRRHGCGHCGGWGPECRR